MTQQLERVVSVIKGNVELAKGRRNKNVNTKKKMNTNITRKPNKWVRNHKYLHKFQPEFLLEEQMRYCRNHAQFFNCLQYLEVGETFVPPLVS